MFWDISEKRKKNEQYVGIGAVVLYEMHVRSGILFDFSLFFLSLSPFLDRYKPIIIIIVQTKCSPIIYRAMNAVEKGEHSGRVLYGFC